MSNKNQNIYIQIRMLNCPENKDQVITFSKGSQMKLGEFYGSFFGSNKTFTGVFGNDKFAMGEEHLIAEYLIENEKYKDVMNTLKEYTND